MSTPKPNLAVLDRIKRSDLPRAEVYVAEEPSSQMRNLNEIGDDDFPMSDSDSSFPKRAARTNPVLYERLKEQEAIANTPIRGGPEEPPKRDDQLVENRYTRLMLGAGLGFLLILAFKNFESVWAILKRLF